MNKYDTQANDFLEKYIGYSVKQAIRKHKLTNKSNN